MNDKGLALAPWVDGSQQWNWTERQGKVSEQERKCWAYFLAPLLASLWFGGEVLVRADPQLCACLTRAAVCPRPPAKADRTSG